MADPVKGVVDKNNPGAVALVTGVFWSKQRCWAGDKVTISLIAQNAANGTSVAVRILPQGNDTPVDTVTGMTLSSNKAKKDYTLAWAGKPIPAGVQQFNLVAVLGTKPPSDRSPNLYVDLETPTFSA